MALQTPNLDDRKFQDIVSEARSKIPLYCPKWTDYNLSDPGITLIELFAWMVDMLLYRLNRVPEKNYIKFMELIGLQLQTAVPATVNVTFRLSAPQPETVVIPKGTEVATVRTETQEAIVFTTTRDLPITVPELLYAMTTTDDAAFKDCLQDLNHPDVLTPIFEEEPKENNALYLGYRNNLGSHMLILTMNCSIEGIGVDPRNPPLAWEYWDCDKEKWLAARLVSDSTGGLNSTGLVIIDIPETCALKEVDGKKACWIRCRATKPRPTQRPYISSPKIFSVLTDSIGGTVQAKHAFRITGQVLGRSNGTQAQRFQLPYAPVLPREPGETIEVETDAPNEFEEWLEVTDFSECGENEPCFTCDSMSGEVQFGPSIKLPSGGETQFGKIPPEGRRVRVSSYRCGGGVIGNVGAGTISVLKSSIPYVSSVTNLEAARGGLDAETLEHATMRVPEVLRARTRAVTADDFEYFALQASPLVARARCLASGASLEGGSVPAGTVRLLLIPAIPESEGPVSAQDLELSKRLKDSVQSYLDERRLLATHLEVGPPEYRPVAIVASVKARLNAAAEQVSAEIEKRLYRYINPVCGGPDGRGWEFGRSLSLSEIYTVIQGIDTVDYIEKAEIYPVDAGTGERLESSNKISIPANAVLCSAKHEITVT